jgi:four helix bundle protein
MANDKSASANLKYRAYCFSLQVARFVYAIPDRDKRVEVFMIQLLRCATSVGANIIEAQAGSSKKDFINFYHHALKSANETKFWLCLIRDLKICNTDEIKVLLSEADQVSRMIASSIMTMKKK